MKAYLYILVSLCCVSCVTVYIPTPHNTPMFSKKNEFQAAVSAGTGINLRTAYSLTDNLGITTSYHDADNRAINDYLDATQWRTHRTGEFSIGYYKNTKNDLYFDLFAGAGIGKGKAQNTVSYSGGWFWTGGGKDYYEGESSYQKFFLQPSLGKRWKRIAWNGSLRFSYVNFTYVHVTENDEQISFGNKRKTFLSIGSECRVTIVKEKLYGSVQGALVLLAQRDQDFIYFEFVNVSGGIVLKL